MTLLLYYIYFVYIRSNEAEILQHKNELEALKRQHIDIIGKNEDFNHDLEHSIKHLDVLTSQHRDVILIINII